MDKIWVVEGGRTYGISPQPRPIGFGLCNKDPGWYEPKDDEEDEDNG